MKLKEFETNVICSIIETNTYPTVEEFIEWLYDMVEMADDPEARAIGMFYRIGEWLYFEDTKVSCWEFIRDMTHVFENMNKRGWRYVSE